MNRFSALLSVLVGVFATPVAAQECGCTSYPFAGTYSGGGETVTLAYLDGDDTTCPTQMSLVATRQGAPFANVVLSCEGGQFRGTETTPLGAMSWQVRGEASSETVGLVPSHTAIVGLTPPPGIGQFREFPLTYDGGSAPDCFCGRVRDERDFADHMANALTDSGMIALARANGLRGSRSSARWTLDEVTGQIVAIPGRSALNMTYEEVIIGLYHDYIELTPEGGIIDNSVTTVPAPRSNLNATPESSNALAMTHPIDCNVTFAANQCEPAVMNEAVLAHEMVHVGHCQLVNGLGTYLLPDGTETDWTTDTFGLIRGTSYGPSPYSAWAEDVGNQALDEGGAYAAEIAYYDAFLAEFCEG